VRLDTGIVKDGGFVKLDATIVDMLSERHFVRMEVFEA